MNLAKRSRASEGLKGLIRTPFTQAWAPRGGQEHRVSVAALMSCVVPSPRLITSSYPNAGRGILPTAREYLSSEPAYRRAWVRRNQELLDEAEKTRGAEQENRSRCLKRARERRESDSA